MQNGVNVITQIRIAPFNFVTETNRGFDIEASYRTKLDDIVPAWGGDLTLRFLATHFLKNYQNTGISPPTDRVGQNGAGSGPPHWRYVGEVGWSNDPITATLTARGVKFEDYDMPGMDRESHILTGGGAKAAWFKDAEGNIMAIVQSLED